MNSRVVLALCVALVASNTFGRIVPHKDTLDGVLDAELVVIVRQEPAEKPKLFQIEEVFLGDHRKNDYIDLGDLKLETIQENGPTVIEPITPDTRILLFLQHKKESSTAWEPTYFQESCFWVQRPQDVPLLRRAAERAIEARQQWESAVRLSDPEQRVAALWPFLSIERYGVSFSEHTEVQFEKAKPASGKYFAERFDGMSANERMLLLPGAGAFGSEQLHMKLKAHLDHLRQRYEGFVAASGRPPKDVDWDTMQENVKDVSGELYYGLAGLAKFDDPHDLAYIRVAALWSAKYHLEQMADAAVDAFRDMPDAANLPAIDAILKEFMPQRRAGMWSIDSDAERALCKHRYSESVPLLTLFLVEDSEAEEAQECLAGIVGHDLGRNPKSWLDWYRTMGGRAPIS